MFETRLENYIDALAYMLNTGQGVVMNRSVFSDAVFYGPYVKAGFYPKTMPPYFEKCWENLQVLLPPHCVVYLDTPVDKVLENIKKRGRPHEVNSPVYTREILKDIEIAYKDKFLPHMRGYSEVLAYDCSDGFDEEILLEDLEKVNLEPEQNKEACWHWNLSDYGDKYWNYFRMQYSNPYQIMCGHSNVAYFDCTELEIPGWETFEYCDILETADKRITAWRNGETDELRILPHKIKATK